MSYGLEIEDGEQQSLAVKQSFSYFDVGIIGHNKFLIHYSVAGIGSNDVIEISLFYSQNSDLSDGVLIAKSLPIPMANEQYAHMWEVEGLVIGSYFVFGQIEDHFASILRYSPKKLIKVHENNFVLPKIDLIEIKSLGRNYFKKILVSWRINPFVPGSASILMRHTKEKERIIQTGIPIKNPQDLQYLLDAYRSNLSNDTEISVVFNYKYGAIKSKWVSLNM